jgi:hypothetical protein
MTHTYRGQAPTTAVLTGSGVVDHQHVQRDALHHNGKLNAGHSSTPR